MRYYTKEWYKAVNKKELLSCKTISDADCTEEGVERLYRSELERFYDSERLLAEHWECQFSENKSKRKFDSELKKIRIPRAKELFPQWITDTVDEKLLAFGYLPESICARFKTELEAEIKAREAHAAEGEELLRAQDLTDDIRQFFRFNGDFVLATRRSGKNYYVYVENLVYQSPMRVKIIFKNVFSVHREKELRIYASEGSDNFFYSNCEFIRDEIYRTANGYEVHMLLRSHKGLHYLTVECEDIDFDGEFEIEKIIKTNK